MGKTAVFAPSPQSNKMISSTRLKKGIEHLSEQGFSLFSILDYATLPATIQKTIPIANVTVEDKTLPARVLLLGHGGKQLWRAMEQANAFNTADPVDTFSINTTRHFLEHYLDSPPSLLLYPTADIVVPLQQLGTLAGWHQPSPLGIGINVEFGLWWAYRTAVYIRADLPIIKQTLPELSTCGQCVDKTCVLTCPSNAVHVDEPLDFPACMEFRLRPQSRCANQCVARRACPIAPEHEYTTAQMAHHYGSSLVTLQKWAKQ